MHSRVQENTNSSSDIVVRDTCVPIVRSIDVNLVRLTAPHMSCRIGLVEGIDDWGVIGLDRHCRKQRGSRNMRRRGYVQGNIALQIRGLYTYVVSIDT
jgi:hypothetical protein